MIYHIYWPAKKQWFSVFGNTKRDALNKFKLDNKLTRMPMGHIVRKGKEKQ